MPHYHGDKLLPSFTSFTINDEQFPANFLTSASPEDLSTRGIHWVPPVSEGFLDKRFYNNWVIDGKLRSEPKDMDSLKVGMMSDLKRAAHSKLAATDWYVIRNTETGVAIPEDWADYRADVREECNRQETQIESAENVEALAAIMRNWPMSPDEKAQQELREANNSEGNNEQ